ncbi:MAG TPA: hypothetical protein VHH73_06120 [Verrucomicrobiae bacterium]|nr:hypothetical protein [Verrucomicrobiae bacterium]
MEMPRLICLLAFVALQTVASPGAELPSLDPRLEVFRPLLEKTWRGPFKDSKPDKATVDICRWERALNGKAIRILHSINDGVYGGETLMTWDEKKQQITYHYFTTAGFMTVGTVTVDREKFTTHETVTGNKEGITEVRGANELLPGGGFHVKSEYLKNGQWAPGHEVTYTEDPAAKVVFR